MSDHRDINKVKISKDFWLKEFECPCCGAVKLHPNLVSALQKFRNEVGGPITPVDGGGYRCKAYHLALYHVKDMESKQHNIKPLSVPTASFHLTGMAVDPNCIISEDMIPMLVLCGFGGIGWGPYQTHLDVRGILRDPIVWRYE